MKSKSLLIKIVLGNLVTIIVLAILTIIFLPIDNLNKDTQIADDLLKNPDTQFLALTSYQKAQQNWPILKYNLEFQQKLSKSKSINENLRKTQPALYGFLKDSATSSEVENLINSLKQNSSVTNVKYISKEDTYNLYKEQHKNETSLLQLMSPNILPASIEVYLSDWSKQNDIKTYLQTQSSIDEAISNPKIP